MTAYKKLVPIIFERHKTLKGLNITDFLQQQQQKHIKTQSTHLSFNFIIHQHYFV
jgi:hypothetical protein